MVILKKINNNTCWGGYEGTETLTLLVGMQRDATTLKMSLSVLQTIKYTYHVTQESILNKEKHLTTNLYISYTLKLYLKVTEY